MTEPTPPTPPTGAPLQFDRAVSKDGAAKTPGVTCSMCGKTVTDRYYTLGDQPACVACKSSLERDAFKAKNTGVFAKSTLYGFGAALAGAALYYAVLKLLNLEIGLVAIAIGYMVGYSMRKGAKGWGGRRFQLAAAGLTYFSVALAYLPIAIESAGENDPTAATADSTAVATDSTQAADSANVVLAGDPAAADSTTVVSADSTVVTDSTAVADSSAATDSTTASSDSTQGSAPATDDSAGIGTILLALAAAFVLALALPIMVIIGSMPGGLISALIIGFGMQQAWKMTAGPDLSFQGPLTVAK